MRNHHERTIELLHNEIDLIEEERDTAQEMESLFASRIQELEETIERQKLDISIRDHALDDLGYAVQWNQDNLKEVLPKGEGRPLSEPRLQEKMA